MFELIDDEAKKNFIKIIQCDELKNDIIFVKYNISENDLINIQDGQCAIMLEKGNILDVESKNGFYVVNRNSNFNKNIDAEWKNLYIRDSENETLCVIFLNLNLITNNKYVLNNSPIKFIDLKTDDFIKKHINLEAIYDFKIKEPSKMLSKVVGLRNHFSKQELIEKIRSLILNHLEKVINETLIEYKFDIDTLINNFKELDINLKKSWNDLKLLEYGVEISNFDVKNFEIINRKFKFF